MEMRGKRVLLCNCESSMPLDKGRLSKACRALGAEGELELNSQLCRAQLGNFQQAIVGSEPVMVACTQEAPLFREVTEEVFGAPEEASEAERQKAQEATPEVTYLNIRETAGWSEEGGGADAAAKIAALLAEAAQTMPPTPTVTMTSGGVCLVYGRDEQAIEAAKRLNDRLDVTVLLKDPGEVLPPRVMDVPVFTGRITQAKGHLGAFAINLDGYAPASPSSRGALSFEAPRNNVYSECDLILDLTGEPPLFLGDERRDGYYRPDPGNPAEVERALFELAEMVGEFEKPRYVDYHAAICAHSRSRKTGCTRCLDVCPTGAITPNGDQVAIDPYVCGGCGLCASVCPTGAATYQLPAGDSLFNRLRGLLSDYQKAGGQSPLLLVHDPRHGDELISLLSRLGRGLPGHVIPFAVNEVTQIGLDFLSSALAYGAAGIALLVGPEKKDELEGLAGQIGLAETVMEGLGYGGGRIAILDEVDPDAVGERLWSWKTQKPAPAGVFLPMGSKRSRTLLALRHLHDKAPEPVEELALPQGAPFGAVLVDQAGCTLCLACVSACPTGALQDDEQRPWLGFVEEACVQCGLCKNTCPEQVITLQPRLSFAEEARHAATKNQEPPFHCIRCGKPFGVQRTIERIAGQLAQKHSMFLGGDAVERIMMCDDCRVVVQFEDPNMPMAGAPRPRIRTTEDYLREREQGLVEADTDDGPGGDGETRH